MANNSSIELLPGFLTVEPIEKLSEVAVLITVDTGSERGLSYKNNILAATSLGKYRVRFSALKSATKEISDTIIVNVVENFTSPITQIVKQLTVGDTLDINEVLQIDSLITNYTISTDSILTCNNLQIIANSVGEAQILISYDVNYIRRKQYFNFTIKQQPSYSIKLIDLSFNTEIIESSIIYNCNIVASFFIQYEIINYSEEYVSQDILIETNTEMLTYTVNEPLIKIKCLSKGSVSFKIICADNKEIYVNLTINFV